MESSNMPDLDRLLEQELKRQVATHPGNAADPGMARYHAAFLRGGMHMPFVPSFLAGLSAKGAAGLALAAITVGGGAAAATVVSHDVNVNISTPWGQLVVGQVSKCKAEFGPSASPTATPSVSPAAKANIGQCVSALAKTHGQKERKLHAHATPSGRPSGLPTGRPSGLPTGRPSGLTTGRPSGLPSPKGKGRPSSTPSGH
jgi:hypothetical protein